MVFSYCVIVMIHVIYVAVLGLFRGLGVTVFTSWDFAYMLLSAAVLCIPIPILVRRKTAGRIENIVRHVVHFIITACILLALLHYRGWIHYNNALYMVLAFFVTYVMLFIVKEIKSQQLANELNRRLERFHKGEDKGDRG